MHNEHSHERVARSLSPSLRAPAWSDSAAAYEMKFLLSEGQAQELEGRLLEVLLPDPHCDPALGGMYAITSIACDGASFPVFFRDPRMENRKYRVRRYGDARTVYLECKRSKQGRVWKRRDPVALERLVQLMTEDTAPGAGGTDGEWFGREARALEQGPVCLVRCLRRAMFGETREGAMRVTIDRAIRTARATDWSFEAAGPLRPVLDGMVVCEFKFQQGMPAPLKAVVAAMRLTATRVSKYRASVRTMAQELGVRIDADNSPAEGLNGA